MIYSIAIVVLLCVVVALLALLVHKTLRIHEATFTLLDHAEVTRAEAGSLFAQLQALSALERLLTLDLPLPPMRGWAASPDFLYFLARRILETKPKIVVECSSGVSTVVAARCLQKIGSGHVYSLEHETLYADKTRGLLLEYGLQSWATVLDAPLSVRPGSTPWYSLDALPSDLPPIDLLVVDGPPVATAPMARYPALPRLIDRMAPLFAVLVDDADRADEVAMLERWLREFPNLKSTRIPAEKGMALVERTLP
jgi:rhodanese-related sulfurtransferase